MNPAVRRYAPLGVVLGVQLLLVGLLPSVSRSDDAATASADGFVSPYAADAQQGADPAAPAAGAPAAGAPAAGAPAPGSAPAGAGPATAPGTGSQAAPAASAPAGGVASQAPGGPGATAVTAAGSRAHCVAGRQFDPAIDYFAPPCVARSGGKNPGATYRGVTGTTINILNYYGQGNAAVDAATRVQGLYVSIEQQRAFDKASEDFINAHYELYGRKVRIETVQGTCNLFPPDVACLRNEMRRLVAEKNPFMFRWISPLSSAPFDELSSLKVLNVGGLMFTDRFAQARRPYHWDVHQSGTRIAQAFGEFWCNQLKSGKAAYSAASNQVASVNGQDRVLGIIGTNDPENILMRQEVDRVIRGCGSKVAHTYDASNDLSTAGAQKSAAIAAMRRSPAATTVLCLCNPVGATFVYQEEQQQNYYPENIYAGTVFIDHDDSGQSFMSGSACASGRDCPFTTAFGLSSSEPREPVGKDVAQRVWTASGRSGSPPFEAASPSWDYYQLMASMIQGAGPDLTPSTVEQGAFATPPRGGGSTGHVLRAFGKGSYAWNQDMAVTYWDPRRRSAFNGEQGSFVQVGGRLQLGGYPKRPPAIPSSR